jgi:hypothetical protein
VSGLPVYLRRSPRTSSSSSPTRVSSSARDVNELIDDAVSLLNPDLGRKDIAGQRSYDVSPIAASPCTLCFR